MFCTDLLDGACWVGRCGVSRYNNTTYSLLTSRRKSQLAIKYSYRISEQSPDRWIFWIHASNPARFEESYRDLADIVKIPERHSPQANIFKLIHDWLRDKKNGKWLLILDNLDDASFLFETHPQSQMSQASGNHVGQSLPLIAYLPRSSNGSILITTRTKGVALRLVEEMDMITVEPMNEAQAVALLQKKLEKLGQQENSQDVAELAAALEFMPLAIVQAAAYICRRAPRCSIQQYIEQFQKNDTGKATLLKYEGGHLRRDREAQNSIIITWQISFDHIRQTRRSAADLLSLMSFFDRQGIPGALLQRRTATENSCENLHKPDVDEDDNDDDKDRGPDQCSSDDFEEDILTLRDYSFVSVKNDKTTFEMHRLVQLATRKWLEIHGQLERWKQQYITNLSEEFPSGEYQNWVKCQALFPHAKAAVVQKPKGDDSLCEWASLLYHAAWYAWRKGDAADAEKMSTEATTARSKVLGPEHEQTLSAMAMVGLAYSLGGQWKKAEELRVQVMEVTKRVLGPEHPDSLSSMANLAYTWKDHGRETEALELMEECYQLRKQKLGPGHPNTVSSFNTLNRWK